jgi:hypothetical protein
MVMALQGMFELISQLSSRSTTRNIDFKEVVIMLSDVVIKSIEKLLFPSAFLIGTCLSLSFGQAQNAFAEEIRPAPCQSGNFVTLHDDNNGGGNAVELCPATANIHRMSKLITSANSSVFSSYNYNDRMSSVSGKGPVTLWEDSYEGGRCIILDPKGGMLNLVDYGFDNLVSSAAYGAHRNYGCTDYTQPQAALNACFSVDSRLGWQRFNLPGSFTKVSSISGGWSVDTRNYASVGASGHSGRDAAALTPYNQYKYDQRFPFGALLMGSSQGALWIQSPNSFSSAPFGAVDMRINDADNALGDNGGSLEVCFGN